MWLPVLIGLAIIVPVAVGSAQRANTPNQPGGAAQGTVTARVVAAAGAFLATLNDEERAKVTFGFTSSQRTGWSNLPSGIFQRNGLRLGDICEMEWSSFNKSGKVIVWTGKRQNFVSHPAGFTGLEMSKPDFHFSMARLHHRRKELVHNPVLIFRKKEIGNWCASGFFKVFQTDHFQTSAIHKERNTINVAHADKVSTGFNECDKLFAIALGAFAISDVCAGWRKEDHLA
jgi:hypothetical protein